MEKEISLENIIEKETSFENITTSNIIQTENVLIDSVEYLYNHLKSIHSLKT